MSLRRACARHGTWSAALAIGVLVACSSSDPGGGGGASPDSGVGSESFDASYDASVSTDAARPDGDAAPDARDASDEDATPVVQKRISGHVEYDGPVAGAKVTVLAPTSQTTTTDANGDFFFYLPLGSTAIFKVEATNLFPMIRGLVVGDSNRIRVFYLAGQAEKDAAQALGLSFDVTKGIVEADFRNATIGGYGAKLTRGATTVTPGFGIALDGTGSPAQSTKTITGGDGSTLLLGNVDPGTTSAAAEVPPAATLTCTPCDAPSLPVQPGVVTWFDFECGTATDCK